MFANSVIVFKQIVVMFFIMMLGYYIFRKGIFMQETTKSLSGLAQSLRHAMHVDPVVSARI